MRQLRLIIAALFLISPFAVQADLITITGTASSDGDWIVTLIETTYADSQALLESQEWWSDFSLAITFAAAAGDIFGAVNNCCDGREWGAFFAYADFSAGGIDSVFKEIGGGTFHCNFDCESFFEQPFTYAVAQRVPEPGTLALLGIGLAGMGMARRRRKV